VNQQEQKILIELLAEIRALKRQVASLKEELERAVKPAGYLPVKEAARYLGVCSKTVRNYIKQGLLPGIKIKGKIHIPLEALEKFKQDPEEALIKARASAIAEEIGEDIVNL